MTGASSSAPSASVTPIARVPRLRIATTSAPVRTWTPRPAAACSNAFASAPVPPVANTAVPAAPPSVPAESLRKTCAVPVAHGPIAVLRIPRVARGPGWPRRRIPPGQVGDRHRQRSDRLAPGLAPEIPERLAELQPHDRVGQRRRLRVRRRRHGDVREEARDRANLLVEVEVGLRVPGAASLDPAAVLAASPQNVTADPSGIGACIRTVGVTVAYPKRSNFRSLTTEAGDARPSGRARAP